MRRRGRVIMEDDEDEPPAPAPPDPQPEQPSKSDSDDGTPRKRLVKASKPKAHRTEEPEAAPTEVPWPEKHNKRCTDCEGAEGAFAKCGYCPRVFHPYCLHPPHRDPPDIDGRWRCPCCHDLACFACDSPKPEPLLPCTTCRRSFHASCARAPEERDIPPPWECPLCWAPPFSPPGGIEGPAAALPDELLERILAQAKQGYGIRAIRRVCRRWRALADARLLTRVAYPPTRTEERVAVDEDGARRTVTRSDPYQDPPGPRAAERTCRRLVGRFGVGPERLAELDLGGAGLEDAALARLLRALPAAADPARISLSACAPSTAALAALAARLAASPAGPALERLDLSDGDLDGAELGPLVPALRGAPRLAALLLARNDLRGRSGAGALAGLCTLPALAVLDLSRNPLGAGRAAPLAALAEHVAALPALQELRLDACRIEGAAACGLVVRIARGAPELRRLSLARNGLDLAGLAFLEPLLRAPAPPLEALDLSRNRLPFSELQALKGALGRGGPGAPRLAALSLEGSVRPSFKLDALRCGAALAEILACPASPLAALDVSRCELWASREEAAPLLQALRAPSPALRRLALRRWRPDPALWPPLLHLLRSPPGPDWALELDLRGARGLPAGAGDALRATRRALLDGDDVSGPFGGFTSSA